MRCATWPASRACCPWSPRPCAPSSSRARGWRRRTCYWAGCRC
ncbi:MAG: hypothetical protein ACK559_24950 [bacterium]